MSGFFVFALSALFLLPGCRSETFLGASFRADSVDSYSADVLQCEQGQDCSVTCDVAGSCEDTRIECPIRGDCDILCDGAYGNSICANLHIQCPMRGHCAVSCLSGACFNGTVDATDSTHLSLTVASDALSVYLPPNWNGDPRATLSVDSMHSLQLYALFGWQDVDIAVIHDELEAAYPNGHGTMHCGDDYDSACAFTFGDWACADTLSACYGQADADTDSDSDSDADSAAHTFVADTDTVSESETSSTDVSEAPAAYLSAADASTTVSDDGSLTSTLLYVTVSALVCVVCYFGAMVLALSVCFARSQKDNAKAQLQPAFSAVMSRESVPGLAHGVQTHSTLRTGTAVDAESPAYLTSRSPSSKSAQMPCILADAERSPPIPERASTEDRRQLLTRDGVTHQLVADQGSSASSTPSDSAPPPVHAVPPALITQQRRKSFQFPPPNATWQSEASEKKLHQLVVHSASLTASNTHSLPGRHAHGHAHSHSLSISVESVPCEYHGHGQGHSSQAIVYQQPSAQHFQQMLQIMAASQPPSLSSFVAGTADPDHAQSFADAAACDEPIVRHQHLRLPPSQSSQTLKPPESVVSITESDREREREREQREQREPESDGKSQAKHFGFNIQR